MYHCKLISKISLLYNARHHHIQCKNIALPHLSAPSSSTQKNKLKFAPFHSNLEEALARLHVFRPITRKQQQLLIKMNSLVNQVLTLTSGKYEKFKLTFPNKLKMVFIS